METPMRGLAGAPAGQVAPPASQAGLARAPALPRTASAPTQQAPANAPSGGGEAVRARIQSAIDLLQGPLGQQFDDPAFRRAAARYDDFLNGGKQPAGVSKDDLYEFGTRLFTRELRDGVGSQLPDGSTITSKKLVSARQRGNDLILELDVSAQKPDGTHFNYRAPVTKDRTHKETDEVLHLPIDEVRKRIKGARYMATAVEQAGGVQNAIAELQRHAQPAGAEPQAGSVSAPSPGGLQGQQLATPETM